MHVDQGPGDLDKFTVVYLFFFAGCWIHGSLESKEVGEEELVLHFWIQEATLYEQDQDASHRSKRCLSHLEEARLKGSHDVVEEDFQVLRLVLLDMTDETSKRPKRQCPDVNRLISQALKRLLNENLLVFLAIKELNHVDDNLGVDSA